jgi:hypothetical protein
VRNILVLQPLWENNLERLWYSEEEGKEGPCFFILSGKSVNDHIFVSLLVNDFIIISKHLGYPYTYFSEDKIIYSKNT